MASMTYKLGELYWTLVSYPIVRLMACIFRCCSDLGYFELICAVLWAGRHPPNRNCGIHSISNQSSCIMSSSRPSNYIYHHCLPFSLFIHSPPPTLSLYFHLLNLRLPNLAFPLSAISWSSPSNPICLAGPIYFDCIPGYVGLWCRSFFVAALCGTTEELLRNLKIPPYIIQAQVSLRRDLGLFKDFAASVERELLVTCSINNIY